MRFQIHAARTIAFLLLAIILGAGCASKTLMESRPAGAEVTVDGEYYVGETPVEVRDLPWRGSTRHYQFAKDGYHPRVMKMNASGSTAHVVTCLCTLGIFWPLLLFGEYPEDLVVVLERKEEAPEANFQRDPDVSFGVDSDATAVSETESDSATAANRSR